MIVSRGEDGAVYGTWFKVHFGPAGQRLVAVVHEGKIYVVDERYIAGALLDEADAVVAMVEGFEAWLEKCTPEQELSAAKAVADFVRAADAVRRAIRG